MTDRKASDASQRESDGCEGRQKATAEMRVRAKLLRQEADGWMDLANALDAIEREATASVSGGDDGSYIGAGSDAERFLWSLAAKGRQVTILFFREMGAMVKAKILVEQVEASQGTRYVATAMDDVGKVTTQSAYDREKAIDRAKIACERLLSQRCLFTVEDMAEEGEEEVDLSAASDDVSDLWQGEGGGE